MRWLEVAVTTAPPAVDAVADIFFQSRCGGIVEHPAGSGLVRVRAYLPAGPAASTTLRAVRGRLRSLPRHGLPAGPARITIREVDDAAWEDAWKSRSRPVAAGRLWITPTWDRTPRPRGAVVIELDPGMAFGSGAHASTQLCLRALDAHLRGGEVVIDVGTGSGILAIAAAKLGARRVLAVDRDPVAVQVALGNVTHNAVGDRVTVREGDMLRGVRRRADLITANLTADLHRELLPAARSHLRPHGLLVASGVAAERLREVRALARAAGFRIAGCCAPKPPGSRRPRWSSTNSPCGG